MRVDVLVVDDYTDSREMLAVALASAGYAVLTAENGWRALVEARRFLPAAIVMDIFMPELDGIEATRQLKSDPATRAIPVIAYTADASVDGLAVFDAFCLKPCPPDRLVQIVAAAIDARKNASEAIAELKLRAVALRERALTLCRAFTRPSMRQRLGAIVAALGGRIEQLDELAVESRLPPEAVEYLSEPEARIAELEGLLQSEGPDVDRG